MLFVFFLFYLVGMVLLYLWLRSQALLVSFNDVMFTAILSAGIGLVFSFAASKANLSHWAAWVAFSGLGILISYKLFEKKK